MTTALWRRRWLCAAPLVRPGNECWQSHCALNACWTQRGRVKSCTMMSQVSTCCLQSVKAWQILTLNRGLYSVWLKDFKMYIFNHVDENTITSKTEDNYFCFIHPSVYTQTLKIQFNSILFISHLVLRCFTEAETRSLNPQGSTMARKKLL